MARVMTGLDLTQAQPARLLVQVAPTSVLLIHGAADDYVPATPVSFLPYHFLIIQFKLQRKRHIA